MLASNLRLRNALGGRKNLPQTSVLQADFAGLVFGKAGRMHIIIECHACFEQLFLVLEQFRKVWPDVDGDVDIRPDLAFDAVPALCREEIDMVVSSDPEDPAETNCIPLFDYEPVFVAFAAHPLALKAVIEAEDFVIIH